MKIRAAALLAVLTLALAPAAALAQSSPNLSKGQVPTAGQWNSYFASKQDVLGYVPLNRGGGVMSGPLGTAPSSTTTTGLNVAPGVAPTTPNNGDIWVTSAGLFVQVNGSTVGPLVSAAGFPIASVSNSDGTLTISPTTGAVIASLNVGHANTWTAVQTISLNAAALGSAQTGTVLRVASADGSPTRIELNSFGSMSFISMVCSGGTAASRTTLTAGTQCGGYNMFGYDGTAIGGPAATFRTFANQTWAVGAHGSFAEVAVTPNASTTLTPSMRFEANGGVTVPPTVTGGNQGVGTINASGLFINGTAIPASVSNNDGTLTISPTSGAVVASINLANANTWTALQSLTINQNAVTNWSVTNNSAGTGALAYYNASNGTVTGSFGVGGTGYTGVPIFQNRVFISSGGALVLDARLTSNPIILATNDVEAARVLLGFSVGTTTDPGAGIINVLTGFRIGNAATSGNVLRGDGANFTSAQLATTDLSSAAALTKTDDTNVTLTLGGTPTTALLRAASLTLGWTSQLAVARGGTACAAASGTCLDNITGFSSTGMLARTASGTYAFRTITGTSNRLTVTNGDGVSGNPTLDISTSYVGQATITTLGTITTGVWTGTAIAAANGGTGLTTYAVGDLIYASATTPTLSKLAAVATGSLLGSAGTSTAPAYCTACTLTTSLTTPLHIGGTAVGSSLTLQSTSGVGAGDFVAIKVGNNGGTEAMRAITSGFVGIGTTAPDARFTVQANTALPATLPGGTTVHINGLDATLNAVALDGYAQQSYIAYRRANTSAGSPSALAAGNVIGGFQWLGYGTTGYGTSARIVINGVAAEAWSDTAQGAYISFFSTALTTTSVSEKMRLQGSGGITVGNGILATDPGAGAILAETSIKATTTLTIAGMGNAATTSAVCYNTGTGLLTYDGTIGTCTVSTLAAKNLVAPLTPREGFDIVMAMEPWRYELKRDLPTYKPGEQIGFVAEFAMRQEPRLVATSQGKVDGFLYEQYTAALTGAVKHLSERIKQLEQERSR